MVFVKYNDSLIASDTLFGFYLLMVFSNFRQN